MARSSSDDAIEPTSDTAELSVKIVAFAQKPLDVLNALEYMHLIGEDPSRAKWLVIGQSTRQKGTMAFLEAQGMDARRLFCPDLLMRDALVRHTSMQSRLTRRVLQGSLLP